MTLLHAPGHDSAPAPEMLRLALAGLWGELPQLSVCGAISGLGLLLQQLGGGLAGPWYFALLTPVAFPLLLALAAQVRRVVRGDAVRVRDFLTSLPRALSVSCRVAWPMSIAGFLTQVAVFVWSTQHVTWALVPTGAGLVLTLTGLSWAVVTGSLLMDVPQRLKWAGWTALGLMVRRPIPAVSVAACLVITDWAYAHVGVVMLIGGPLLIALVWALACETLARAGSAAAAVRPR